MNEHNTVELLVDINENIRKGAKGTIVYVYNGNFCNGMFLVEFFDDEHNTIGIERVFEKNLKII